MKIIPSKALEFRNTSQRCELKDVALKLKRVVFSHNLVFKRVTCLLRDPQNPSDSKFEKSKPTQNNSHIWFLLVICFQGIWCHIRLSRRWPLSLPTFIPLKLLKCIFKNHTIISNRWIRPSSSNSLCWFQRIISRHFKHLFPFYWLLKIIYIFICRFS